MLESRNVLLAMHHNVICGGAMLMLATSNSSECFAHTVKYRRWYVSLVLGPYIVLVYRSHTNIVSTTNLLEQLAHGRDQDASTFQAEPQFLETEPI